MTSTADLARMREEIVRDLSGETFCGLRVAAWRETHPEHGDKYGHKYSEHWSTPSESPDVKVERLFTETQVLSLLDRIAELEGEREIQRIELIRSDNRADALYHRALAAEAQVSALQAQVDGLRADASRWRALMRCGRIKMQGSSGVDPNTGERNGNNVHFGAEFWPEPLPQDYREKCPEEAASYDRNTRWGVAALTALADAVMEIEALSQPPADEPAKGEA